jgi:UDP-N-acetylmuramate: L-alanyl-gamma-D-glutamyl-meso-diaminopimelate ligase
MKIHILGICGTFMGGLAALAREAGLTVTGSDKHAYPPMSTQLRDLGVDVKEGYLAENIPDDTDLVIVGNALSRGNEAVEHVLNSGFSYTSGPRWLGEKYLRGRTVIAIAGTHGKTTTSSMVAWILEHVGLKPGFLIGGVPLNFGISARGGEGPFVVEADEYDTSFFDKRAKFVHYRPQVAVLNNLEFDHADIYDNVEAIQTQFHHLIRTIPGKGKVIANGADMRLQEVEAKGCWSQLEHFGEGEQDEWQVQLDKPDASIITLLHRGQKVGTLEWSLTGRHNAYNAAAAVAAACEVGVEPAAALEALTHFRGVKRRLEKLAEHRNVVIYDDFAHHPTAIRMTLDGLRRHVGNARLWVVLEPRSNTMRAGHHKSELAPALTAADHILLLAGSNIDWDPMAVTAALDGRGRSFVRGDDLLQHLMNQVKEGDRVVFMSNGGFEGLPHRFAEAWKGRNGRA